MRLLHEFTYEVIYIYMRCKSGILVHLVFFSISDMYSLTLRRDISYLCVLEQVGKMLFDH